jgi:toxin ParE1/3/4
MAHRRAPQADSDLDDIWYYVATKSGSMEVADRLIDSITDRFFLLASHPNVGRARDEDLRPGLRTFPVGNYVIIYRIDEEDVLILRVLRGSRNIEALFSGYGQ